MYEHLTYEAILERMMARVPDNMDKREGSVIFNALAPAALEIKNLLVLSDEILNNSFGDTADREHLIRRAKERGMIPLSSVGSLYKMAIMPTSIELQTGDRFFYEAYHFKVEKRLEEEGSYQVRCEEAGAHSNHLVGTFVVPVEYIPDLQEAKLIELLIPGQDEEHTEVFRKRYLESFDVDAYGGNIRDYQLKVRQLANVGAVKVFPVWNGGGTVKILVLDNRYRIATEDTIKKLQTEIDPEVNRGKGYGVAPIGHVVTVESPQSVPINLEIEIQMFSGHKVESIKSEIEELFQNYIDGINQSWESKGETGETIIRIAQIQAQVLDLPNVEDIGSCTINGESKNIRIPADSISVKGAVHVREKAT